MAKLVHIIRIEEIDTSKLYDMEVLGPHLCRLKSNVNFKKINIYGLVGNYSAPLTRKCQKSALIISKLVLGLFPNSC